MKSIFNSQKILTESETIYIGEPRVNLTLSSGVHIFNACAGSINITSSSVVVYAGASPTLQITNSVGATTYRGNYAIGDLLLTTNGVSPAIRYGGTWKQLTADAYFKIVTSGAGSMGGTSSQHKIPVASMPAHTHVLDCVTAINTAYPQCNIAGTTYDGARNQNQTTYDTGGNKPYYPYYYGVLAWRRTSYQNKE